MNAVEQGYHSKRATRLLLLLCELLSNREKAMAVEKRVACFLMFDKGKNGDIE